MFHQSLKSCFLQIYYKVVKLFVFKSPCVRLQSHTLGLLVVRLISAVVCRYSSAWTEGRYELVGTLMVWVSIKTPINQSVSLPFCFFKDALKLSTQHFTWSDDNISPSCDIMTVTSSLDFSSFDFPTVYCSSRIFHSIPVKERRFDLDSFDTTTFWSVFLWHTVETCMFVLGLDGKTGLLTVLLEGKQGWKCVFPASDLLSV